jgi:hypothetical protein
MLSSLLLFDIFKSFTIFKVYNVLRMTEDRWRPPFLESMRGSKWNMVSLRPTLRLLFYRTEGTSVAIQIWDLKDRKLAAEFNVPLHREVEGGAVTAPWSSDLLLVPERSGVIHAIDLVKKAVVHQLHPPAGHQHTTMVILKAFSLRRAAGNAFSSCF